MMIGLPLGCLLAKIAHSLTTKQM